MDFQTNCPFCKGIISPADYFCPTCGSKLKAKPLSTTLSKQIWIYLISLFLPPIGVWPAIKYLRQPDVKSKKIGWIAIFLTIASILITVWLTIRFMNLFNQGLNSQFNLYPSLD